MTVSSNPTFTPTLVEELLARALGPQADQVLRERMLRTLLETAMAGAQRVAETLNINPTVIPSNPTLQRLATDRIPQIVGINETTRIRIRDALATAIANGENLPGQMAAIREVFQEATTTRARTIARTENGGFWNGGAHRQMADAGVQSHLWLTSRDPRVRASHVFMEGQCRPIGEAFDSGLGNKLFYPGDQAAPPADTVNCFLPGTQIRGDITAAVRSLYEGPAVELVTRSGQRLRLTANHPVLTSKGFRPAAALREHDKVFSYGAIVDDWCGPEGHQYDRPAVAEDVFEALVIQAPAGRRHLAADDLHGDARFLVDEVDIVSLNGELGDEGDASCHQRFLQLPFVLKDMCAPQHSGLRAPHEPLHRIMLTPPGAPGGGQLSRDSGVAVAGAQPFQLLRFGSATDTDPTSLELPGEISPVLADLICQGFQGYAGIVAADEIIEVNPFSWRGHVYDFEALGGLLIASNLIVSNCRCEVAPKVDPCGTRSAWLATYRQRTIYWKMEIRAVEARERVVLRTLQTLLREQRAAVLTAAEALIGRA